MCSTGSQTSLKMTRQSSSGSIKAKSSTDKTSRKGKDNRSKAHTETRVQKEMERRSCNNARERYFDKSHATIQLTLIFVE